MNFTTTKQKIKFRDKINSHCCNFKLPFKLIISNFK